MALMAEVKRVAAEFEFTDEDVNRSVKEFIAEMSKCSPGFLPAGDGLETDGHVDEGLEKNATTMSQIPTYVTAVPNGTEKVSYGLASKK